MKRGSSGPATHSNGGASLCPPERNVLQASIAERSESKGKIVGPRSMIRWSIAPSAEMGFLLKL